jgi:anti-sigma regulatory factor (Ser/Thr protein kinase)
VNVITDWLTLAAEPSAVQWGRRHVASCLNAWRLNHLVDDATLITSELLTNAVRATGNPNPGPGYVGRGQRRLVAVRVQVLGPSLIVEVWDTSVVPPTIRATDQNAEGGRGMPLVAELSQRWGVWRPREGGKVVFAKLPLQPPPPEEPAAQPEAAPVAAPGPVAPGPGQVPTPGPVAPGPGPVAPDQRPVVPVPGPVVPRPGQVPGQGPRPGPGPVVPTPGQVPRPGPMVPVPGPVAPGQRPVVPVPGPMAPRPGQVPTPGPGHVAARPRPEPGQVATRPRPVATRRRRLVVAPGPVTTRPRPVAPGPMPLWSRESEHRPPDRWRTNLKPAEFEQIIGVLAALPV